MKQMKNTRGITLISLVITIIILIILAGISLSVLYGENGLLTKVQESSQTHEIEYYKEKIKLLESELYIDNQGDFNIYQLKNKIISTNTIPDGTIIIRDDELNADVTTKEGYEFVITATTTYKPGLYDKDYKLLVTWENSGIDIEKDYDIGSSDTHKTSGSYVLNNIYPNTTKIVLPNNIKRIGSFSFGSLPNLEYVKISDSVETIGESAFYITGLSSIEIPSNVTNIEPMAFSGCTNLSSIIVNKQNPVYDSRDNCNAIIETASNTLLIGCSSSTIPDTIESIGQFSLTLTMIESIEIPASVTNIELMSFAGCINLSSIIVDQQNPVYDSRDNCNAIIETSTNTLISGCNNTVKIPNSITSIADMAFLFSCIKNIEIPASVTSIGMGAFGLCPELSNINYRGSEEQWKSIEFGSGWNIMTNATIVYNYSE